MARAACAGEQARGCWCAAAPLVLEAERAAMAARREEERAAAEKLTRNRAEYEARGGFSRWLVKNGAVERPLRMRSLRQVLRLLQAGEPEVAKKLPELEERLSDALRAVRALRVARRQEGLDA